MSDSAHLKALRAGAKALCALDGKDPNASWEVSSRGPTLVQGELVRPTYRSYEWEQYYSQAVATVTAYLAALGAEGYEFRPKMKELKDPERRS